MSQIAPTISPPQTFDAGQARKALGRNVALAIVATALVIAAILVLVDRADWWRGFIAATVVSLLAAGASLVPLMRGLGRGYAALPGAVMTAAAVRTVVSVGACLLAVVAGKYPPVPTFMLMMAYYLALLAVETLSLTRLGKIGSTHG